ncbi:MAG: hypothetical protein M1296_06770 [Chloroflexi bacterium]|nr:hypothetical protein [Chloroflexota bacterium]
MNKRTILGLLVGSSTIAAVALPGAAFAAAPAAPVEAGTASNPIALSGSYSGTLAANSGGSYDYFQLPYTANSSVNLTLSLPNAVTLENGASGFNVYLNGTLIGNSVENATTATYTINAPASGTALVQVYNYDPVNGINFTLSTGSTSSTAATTSPTTVGSAATTGAIMPLGGSASGSLAGNSGGSYALYSVNYANSAQMLTLTMSTTPSVDVTQGAAGFNVYDASGNLVGGATLQSDGTLALTLNGNPTGTYTVQVYNYDPTNTISYTLTQSAS